MTEILSTDTKVDIALIKGDDGIYDFEIGDDGDFVPTYGFDSSIRNSVYNEQRASAYEQPIAQRRKGWIGSESAEQPGFEGGSKLYNYYQARGTLDTKNGVADEFRTGLAWLTPDYLAGTVITGKLKPEGVEIEVQAIRKDGKIDKLYFRLWELTGITL